MTARLSKPWRCRVICRCASDKIPTSSSEEQPIVWPKHVLRQDWLPLNDLLGHANTRLLISHCGANSQFEVGGPPSRWGSLRNDVRPYNNNKLCAWRHDAPAPPDSRVKAALSKAAWWPWPLTFWPWKWCPTHVWRELHLCQFWSSWASMFST